MAETKVLTLIEFLLARIAEDEAVAKSISLDPDGVAKQRFGRPGRLQWVALALDRPWRGGVARVLVDCEAKRRVANLPLAFTPDQRRVVMPAIEHAWKLLAAVYADHADYREEWRP